MSGNRAISLGGYLWAVSSIKQEQLQVRCLEETHMIEIQPPLQIVYFERSHNTVLLASTQAVYKAPHSTVQGSQFESVRTHSDTVTVAVGSLRA